MFTTLLVQPLANGLVLVYNLIGNLGWAIIIFSILLRVILNPLTKPYMESMKKMKDMAPLLEKLKKKHKNDKIKLAQAQSELYKQKGVNPGAGCIPYLLQIVILIAFFRMFTLTLSTGSDLTSSFNNLLYEPLKFSQETLINTKFLYLDITQPDVFRPYFLPFAIPGIFLIIAAIVQLLSSKMMAQPARVEKTQAEKTKGQSDDVQAMMQQSMIYTFPIFTLFFGMKFPAGLTLYWMTFSLTQLWQQYNTYGVGEIKPWLNKLGLLKSKSEQL
jgi:YidC/Oxa1 family membrane protein insertase